jgi:dipeptidyl aminopeptidase/acylaminoacyl peptidase
VVLPHESHGYAARESVLHTLAEMTAWLDRYVKQAAPRPAAREGARTDR